MGEVYVVLRFQEGDTQESEKSKLEKISKGSGATPLTTAHTALAAKYGFERAITSDEIALVLESTPGIVFSPGTKRKDIIKMLQEYNLLK